MLGVWPEKEKKFILRSYTTFTVDEAWWGGAAVANDQHLIMAVWTLFRRTTLKEGEEEETALNELSCAYTCKKTQEPENENMLEPANYLRVNQKMYYRCLAI